MFDNKNHHHFNEFELNDKFRTLKANIKHFIIEPLREENTVEFDRNTDYVAEYIRDHIGIGPQKNNPDRQYKVEAIKQNLNVNPSQPPSLRFLLGLCELFNLSLDLLFSENKIENSPIIKTTETPIANKHHKYDKYCVGPFYLYFLDTKKGIDIEEGELSFVNTGNPDQLSVKLNLCNYNKTYDGTFKINSNNQIGQLSLNLNSNNDENMTIMLIDPSVESTKLIGAVGYMLSQSADSVKKPSLNKIILSKKQIKDDDYESRKWLQGLLNITPTGLFIEQTKFNEILDQMKVDPSILDFMNIEHKEHIFIDDPAIWHRRMPEKVLRNKEQLSELISLIRHASVSDSIFKLTETDNSLIYEFLKNYNL